jgi:DNA repair protein RecO (recombination protein O)
MKFQDRGIVLSRAAFSETSLIVTLFTELHGVQTFLFQGAKKKKGLVLFPLATVDITFYRRSDSQMGKLTEIVLAESLNELPFDPIKSSICFFIVELLQKTQQQGNKETALFYFVWQEAVWLNHTKELTNYPLWFLAAYTRFCGITPAVEQHTPTVFDIKEGKLTTIRPNHVEFIEDKSISWFEPMLDDDKINFLALTIPKTDRNELLAHWLTYYSLHLNGMRTLKSIEVIRTILH